MKLPGNNDVLIRRFLKIWDGLVAPARYGGEEFAVILPSTSKLGAIVLAERIRISAEEYAPTKNKDGSPIAGYTISLGVATFPEDADSLGELLLAADNAELTAKRLGKNRVCAANHSKKQ